MKLTRKSSPNDNVGVLWVSVNEGMFIWGCLHGNTLTVDTNIWSKYKSISSRNKRQDISGVTRARYYLMCLAICSSSNSADGAVLVILGFLSQLPLVTWMQYWNGGSWCAGWQQPSIKHVRIHHDSILYSLERMRANGNQDQKHWNDCTIIMETCGSVRKVYVFLYGKGLFLWPLKWPLCPTDQVAHYSSITIKRCRPGISGEAVTWIVMTHWKR